LKDKIKNILKNKSPESTSQTNNLGHEIKEDRTKHISSKFFFTHELDKCCDIDVQQIRSKDNPTNLFIISTITFERL
jgi:hypothetical protein